MTENWVGAPDATAEHRTTGGRAWCFNDSEWCSAGSFCQCCDVTRVPDKWKGLYAGELLAELRTEVKVLRDSASRALDVALADGAVVLGIGAMSNVAAYDRMLAILDGETDE